MNTHSRWADCRMELISAHAALHGADRKTIEALMQAATTDACLDLLESCGLRQKVVETLEQTARANGISKTALIVVGDFLGESYSRSKLYDPAFTTGFREGTHAD